ncbi:MAG TPA: radical SAM protein [Anaerolineae bacterium]|nr:radical SAM protein [Anaerolineae bacterium]
MNKPKLLFGQSYYLRFDPKLWDAMQPYPPLGTMYAASYFRQQGYPVNLFDAMLATDETEWAATLDQHQPDIAIIYEDNFNYLSKMCLTRMRQAAFTMITMARDRDCTVIICGSDATDHAEAYLQQGAHYVLIGEGEATLTELLTHLTTNTIDQHQADILGLAYHTPNGPQRNPRRPDIKTLDDLPFPAWDLIDVPRYRQIWLDNHGYYAMNIVTTRGCPYHCNWCAKPIWGQRYNARSPENVAAEMKFLHDTYQPDYLWFADDIMGLKPKWWPRFAAALQQHNIRIPFKCLSRADLIVRDQDDLEAIAAAGCDIIWMGAESGAQSVLNAMEKGTTVEQIYDATEKLHAAGIKVGFFLQFGYPGETRADIDKTLQMVRDCAPDDIGISVSYPLPGTKFHNNVRAQLGAKQNWTDSADLAMMYAGPFTTAFYRQLHTVIHKEFRSRRTLALWQDVLKKPSTFSPHHLREAAATIYRLATLPLARYKLNQLAKQTNNNINLPPPMTLNEAAQPSPQGEQ